MKGLSEFIEAVFHIMGILAFLRFWLLGGK